MAWPHSEIYFSGENNALNTALSSWHPDTHHHPDRTIYALVYQCHRALLRAMHRRHSTQALNGLDIV
jgi:hypothetical protein